MDLMFQRSRVLLLGFTVELSVISGSCEDHVWHPRPLYSLYSLYIDVNNIFWALINLQRAETNKQPREL